MPKVTCLEHRQHDRLPRPAGPIQHLDDPDGVHVVLPLFSWPSPSLCRRGDRHDRLGCHLAWSGNRRLDHRSLGWPCPFYVNVVPGILVAVGLAALIVFDQPDLTLLRGADYPGIVLMAVALGTLEYGWRKAPDGTGSATKPSGSARSLQQSLSPCSSGEASLLPILSSIFAPSVTAISACPLILMAAFRSDVWP